MSMAQRLSLRTTFLFILAVHVSGCATGMADVTAADVPRLQQAAAASPDDLELRTQFGIALYKAERFNDARTTLGTVVEDGGETGAALFLLGSRERGDGGLGRPGGLLQIPRRWEVGSPQGRTS